MNTVYDAKLLGLPKIEDPRGNLSIIEQIKQMPFEIKRVYWIQDVPGGKDRGAHAYKMCIRDRAQTAVRLTNISHDWGGRILESVIKKDSLYPVLSLIHIYSA